ATPHGGHETTITALNNVFYHWGCIIVSSGYGDAIQFETGNPYGVSFASDNAKLDPDEKTLEAAHFQGRRVAMIAAQFLAGAPQGRGGGRPPAAAPPPSPR